MDARSPDPPSQRLQQAARAAHDLCDALWQSLHQELAAGGAQPERVAQLSRRLADVSSSIALLAAAPSQGAPAEGASAQGMPAEGASAQGMPAEGASAQGVPAQGMPAPAAAVSEVAPLQPPEPAPLAGIAIHDARPSEEPAQPSAWIDSIRRRLQRYSEDRLPFAVLLIEVLGIDQLAHAEPPSELARLVALVERALAAELRPADLLTRESRGRYWLVTPETDGGGGRVLAERLAATVRGTALHRGVGLEVAIGIAVCPDDGTDPAALAAHADVGVYAARAAGRSVAPDDNPAV
jgi:GGDEF domain-containing protein